MFNGVEYVREVCKKRKIPVSILEKDCGFANGYLNPKKLVKLPYERAVIIAKYLNLDVQYLMTGETETSQTSTNNELSNVYFSLAKEAEENGISPDDIRLALDTIKKLRGGNK